MNLWRYNFIYRPYALQYISVMIISGWLFKEKTICEKFAKISLTWTRFVKCMLREKKWDLKRRNRSRKLIIGRNVAEIGLSSRGKGRRQKVRSVRWNEGRAFPCIYYFFPDGNVNYDLTRKRTRDFYTFAIRKARMKYVKSYAIIRNT